MEPLPLSCLLTKTRIKYNCDTLIFSCQKIFNFSTPFGFFLLLLLFKKKKDVAALALSLNCDVYLVNPRWNDIGIGT